MEDAAQSPEPMPESRVRPVQQPSPPKEESMAEGSETATVSTPAVSMPTPIEDQTLAPADTESDVQPAPIPPLSPPPSVDRAETRMIPMQFGDPDDQRPPISGVAK